MRRGHAFQRLAISPRKSDGGIAGDPGRQSVAAEQREFSEAPLNALVDIAQALLKPEHFLADYRKTEVARFDDTCMHGPDRNFMHAVPFHGNERVPINDRH